jgi:hypothetical protein
MHDSFVQESISRGEMADSQTKIMIFSSHRASVDEIVKTLESHRPLVRPAAFIGQSSGKKTAGLKQKQQLQVIDDFMAGLFNVLVSTSIGEEGLDIGEIDLIICFDVSKSPIRLLQRQGRTGRKRIGNICLLLNEGADENAVKNARTQYKSIQKVLCEGKKLEFYNGKLAGILPCIYTPTCEQVQLQIPDIGKKIPKKAKSRKNTGPYLPKEEETRYEQLFFRNYNPVRVELSNHVHWQSQSLKKALIPHSELCETYISLMEYFSELKSEERPRSQKIEEQVLDRPSKVEPILERQCNSSDKGLPSIHDHPSKKKSVFVTIHDSDSDTFLEQPENVGQIIEDEYPGSIKDEGMMFLDPTSAVANHNTQISKFHTIQENPPLFDSLEVSNDGHSDPEVSLRLYQKEEADDEVCGLFTMDHSMYERPESTELAKIPESPILDHAILDDGLLAPEDRAKFTSEVEPILFKNTEIHKADETLLFDEFDDMDFQVIAELERQYRSPLVQSPAKLLSQSEDGSIRIVRKTNRVILDSSSPCVETIHVSDTPEGMKRIQKFRQVIADRKSHKRKAPKIRQALSPNALNKPITVFPKRPKSKKNLLAEGYIDFEAELSGDAAVSADEEDESDRDLSGFVVENSFTTSPANTSIGFYRRSLLSPGQGGLGKVTGNKYRLAPIKFTKTNQKPDDEESLESLADFVVNDSQIEFESQNLETFLDESLTIDEPPEVICKSSTKQITSELEYFDNEIDIDNIDLDDLVEF